ncbi:hypothetical protein M595_4475 [Lyngbya aestuarii BL J]|uniref:Uncharacterized protein n=1 Tax=Lyngbya aestuarii BL J TaxID=1348334 RepID=U7QE94_9CYAN|nr:hypothetical protein M595_4475 [Lyngbya aestuarii BL J]
MKILGTFWAKKIPWLLPKEIHQGASTELFFYSLFTHSG